MTTPITVEKPVPPIATTVAPPAPPSTVALVAAPAPTSSPSTSTPVETVDSLAHTGWGGNILILAGVAGVLAGAALLYSRRFGQTPPVG